MGSILKACVLVTLISFCLFSGGAYLWMNHQASAAVVGAARICGPDATPTPASANGYTCEVFYDNFTSSSTLDSTNTKNSGFKWYFNNQWPGLAEGKADWQHFGVTPSGDITIGAHGLVDTPSNNNASGNPSGGVDLFSCVTTGDPNQYHGFAVDGNQGFYIDVQFYSESSQGKQPGNNWWPVIWMSPIEFQARLNPSPSTAFFGEIDIVEDLTNIMNPYTRNIHAWSILNGTGTEQAGSPQSIGEFIPANLPQTYGVLTIPERRGGGTGSINGYINDVVDPNSGGPYTWTTGTKYEVFETQHYCILITSGFNQATTLGFVRVWQ